MTLVELTMRILRNNAIGAAAAIVIGILTARWLGPEGRGHYALFFTTVGVLGTIGQFGSFQAAVYHIGKRGMSPAVALGTALMLMAAVGCILLTAFGIMRLAWAGMQGAPIHALVGGLLILGVLFQVARESVGGIAMATGHYRVYNEQVAIEPALALLATLPLGFLLLDSATAVALRIASGFVAILILAWRVRQFLPVFPIFDRQALIAELGFGSKNTLQNLIGLLNYRVYLYVLVADPAAVGAFSVAMLFAEFIRFVPNGVGTALLPFLTATDASDAGHLAARSCRIVLALAVVSSALFTLFGAPLLRFVFGTDYLPVLDVMVPMLAGATIGTIYQILTRYFTSMGRQIDSVHAGVAGLIAALIVSALLVPVLGLMGAALAYLASSICSAVVILRSFVKHGGSPVRDVLLMTPADARHMIGRSRQSVQR